MGERLLGEISAATGLPEELVTDELTRLVKAAGLEPKDLTLEDLRKVLAEYVQDVLMSVKSDLDALEK